MVKKTSAYVDTGAFIAFLDRSDTYHPLFRQRFGSPPQLVTTTLVVAEGHGWFLRRYDRTRAMQFLNFLEELSPLTILDVGRDELKETTQVLRKFSDQDLTLADAMGLYIMKKYGLKTCWSADPHLGLTDVSLVIYE